MITYRGSQATDPQKLKNGQQSFSRFLLVEAEAIDVKAEVVDEITASTSLVVLLTGLFS